MSFFFLIQNQYTKFSLIDFVLLIFYLMKMLTENKQSRNIIISYFKLILFYLKAWFLEFQFFILKLIITYIIKNSKKFLSLTIHYRNLFGTELHFKD